MMFCGLALAQDQSRKHSIGLYQVFTDYNVELLNKKIFVFDSSLSHATRLGYQYIINPSWALNSGLSNGFILNQNLKDSYVKKAYTIGLDISLLYFTNNDRFLSQDAKVAPYLGFGYRIEYIKTLKQRSIDPYLMHNQYILGFNIELNPRTHIQLQTALDQQLAGTFNTHLRYRMGIIQSLGPLYERNRKDKTFDSDFDGIADDLDKCPDVYGLAINDGCPDVTNPEGFSEKTQELLQEMALLNLAMDSLAQSNADLQQELDKSYSKISSLEDSLINCGSIATYIPDPRDPDEPPNQGDQDSTNADPVYEPTPSFSVDATDGEGYYIVVKSLKETSDAKKLKSILTKEFGNGHMLLQPSGFYRVAVYAGTDYDKAVQFMQHVMTRGYRPVWITKE